MYAELHARSAFSFLEGSSLPEELAGACSAFGMPAMAIMDRNGVYGAPRFHLAAKKAGIRAHIGSEITCTDGLTYPLLVENREGYRNLCRLVTRMKLRAPKGEGAATPEELAEFAGGLICLTRHPSERLLEIFGRHNLYAELQRHYHRDEEAHNQAIAERARSLGIPLVATNGPAYATPPQRQLLDVFTCIRNHVTLADAGRLLERNSERHVKAPAEMARLFADLPEALAHTLEISSRLQFTLSDLGYEFPRYPVPEGQTEMSFLRHLAEEGARLHYEPGNQRAHRQIERELALIEKLKLPGYFLIVWDIVRFCREKGILAQGRGSAANSAVCYVLRITAVDPVGMELLFERFLSEERGEWPDIDIDLPSGDQRERAIQYVYERYGKLGAAMTANVITYRGRSAAREVGKALGFEITSLEKLTSLVRAWEWKDPKETPDRQFREAGFDIQNPRVRKFFELYRMAQDLPRHLGQHSGGMVICQGQLDSVVPLEPASMPGRVVVQWDKEDCADLGIVKVDLLGLGMMAVLEDCVRTIPEIYGETVDLAHLPPDDPDVYAALQKADTIGMFQVESRAQMATLPRMRPKTFYDIVVQVAIIRPGPIVGKMVHPYLNRRLGKEAPDCLHPSLEAVLRRTLGVPLFQEQLLRMAMIAAGFTGGQAEELRRAMGFKRSEKRMADIEVKLRQGMERNGIRGPAQEAIVHSITAFALYGFPESHAASFALIAYASAWLKCRYLAAFTAAMLNNQPMGFYAPAILIKDAQRHGLRVLPVDVARSEWLCTVEPGVPLPHGRGSETSAPTASAGAIPTPLDAPGSETTSPAVRAGAVPTPLDAPGSETSAPTASFSAIPTPLDAPGSETTSPAVRAGAVPTPLDAPGSETSAPTAGVGAIQKPLPHGRGSETSAPTASADAITKPLADAPGSETSAPTASADAITKPLADAPGSETSAPAASADAITKPLADAPGSETSAPAASADAITKPLADAPGSETSAPAARVGAIPKPLADAPGSETSAPAARAGAIPKPRGSDRSRDREGAVASPKAPILRLGLRYAKGLREESARAILAARAIRPFSSIDDLASRVPHLRKDEINRLAEIGALNSLDKIHRRDALWQAQRAILPVGPLLEPLEETGQPSPLAPMTTEERLWADYDGTGLTIGRHPMAHRRAAMTALGVTRAIDLPGIPNGRVVRIAGMVIVRQRPGTANGFVFLSLEDETGVLNAIITPATFDRYKFPVLSEPFLLIDGVLQNVEGVVAVKAGRVEGLPAGAAAEVHNFH